MLNGMQTETQPPLPTSRLTTQLESKPMQEFKCSECRFSLLRQAGSEKKAYPYLRDADGDKVMWQVSPYHGRSYVVAEDKERGRYVVSKGNGLSYTQYTFLNTGERDDETWGLLLEQDATRDFDLGMEIKRLGIRTNEMECVLVLDKPVMLTNGHIIRPVLLQYNVECPYRISDVAYMPRAELVKHVNGWERLNARGFDKKHLIAANVLISNLHTLHANGILHNAISTHNYTWALELVDFELACSPKHPYTSEDDARHVKDYFDREVIFTYDVINHIAASLGEMVDNNAVNSLLEDYGLCLSKFTNTHK